MLNAPPVADAGPDRTVPSPKRRIYVTLDGSASADSDGTIQSHVWRRNGRVVANGETPRLRLRRGRTYVFELTVTDEDGASTTDEVTIQIVRE